MKNDAIQTTPEALNSLRTSIRRAVKRTLTPAPRLKLSEWCDAYRYLSRESSPEPGRWRTDRAPYQREMLDCAGDYRTSKMVVMSSAQIGKALDVLTPIRTVDGWTTMGDIEVGMTVFDMDGKPTKVTYCSPVYEGRPCYEVSFNDGSTLIADAEHQWIVGERGKGLATYTTHQLLDRGLTVDRDTNRFYLPISGALQLPDAELPLDPYLLGVWLGDGHSKGNVISTSNRDVTHCVEAFERAGFRTLQRKDRSPNGISLKIDPRSTTVCQRGHKYTSPEKHYCRECKRNEYTGNQREVFGRLLVQLGVKNNKHIPWSYLNASIPQRLALLQGLMDTDGYVSKRGRSDWCSSSDRLTDDFKGLLRSLGIKYHIKRKSGAWLIGFTSYEPFNPVRLPFKHSRIRTAVGQQAAERHKIRITAIEPTESRSVRCIQVASKTHSYLAGRELIPTHNTSLIENICAFYISSDPSPILMVMPELQTAKAFSTDRLDPMFRDTPILRGIVKEKRSRDSGNTQLQKRFSGGHLTIIGANSASGLRSRPIRVLLMDEVDAYPVSAGKEGDPVNLATARTSNFWNRKLILTSTPTVKDLSRIEREFNLSDQRYFNVPCPHCGNLDKLKWKNIHWDNNNPDTAHLVCEKCACVIEESDKLAMMQKGIWIKENPGSDIAGFHLNALYSPWRTWKEIARQFLEAKGNPETLKTFVNTVLGEAWEEQGERVDFHTLAQRLEDYAAEVPDGVGILTAGVDVQADRIEVAIWGWGHKEEAWLIATDAIYKDPGTEAAWNDLTLTLSRRYKAANGTEVGVRAVAVDTGFMSEHVYRYVRGFRGRFQMIPVKGGSEPNRPLLGRPKRSRTGLNLFTVGTDTAKDMIFARLKITEHGPGYLHFPTTVDREVLEQITSEKAITTYSKGIPRREWRKTRPRNEQLDMLVYSMAALQSLGTNIIPQLGTIAKTLSESTTDNTPVAPSEPEQPVSTMVQRRIVGRFRPPLGSWNRGWNV